MNNKTSNNECDIVIPIFNAFECLEECIDSVIKNTDLKKNNLVFIDDKSTDERVIKLLLEYEKKHANILLIQNEKNLGFVQTTNKGMKLSKNDVVLLNSDTIVTSGWLEKIKECAYSQPLVATVTPLSNNATLASVPNIFEKNELPKGISLEEMGKIVERCSYRDYPELPTAHGFCMFIKKSVLEEIGYFDEKAFGRGYGEENDFCYRCFDYGYSHLLCDDTYIYHKESQSFSDTKYALMKNGEKVLDERYPKYQIKLRDWCIRRPIRYIGQNIASELGEINKKKNILFIIHDWKNVKGNLGGTTLHAYDLIQNLRDKFNFHVFAPEDGVYKLYSYWTNTESQIKFPRNVDFKDFGYFSRGYEEILEKIIKDFDIRAIHIHHMLGHYFNIGNIIKRYKLYSLLSLHDFYSVCPIINKMFKRREYCGNPSTEKCGECLNYSIGSENNMIENWHKIWRDLFDIVNVVITPSEGAKKEILMTHKDSKIKVIEHGISLKKTKSDLSLKSDEFYEVAFIGVLVKHKGSEVFEYLIKRAKLRNIRIHLFGVSDLLLKDSKYFKNHGKYEREELPKLLKENNIKLTCLLSMCPESYSYTLTESVACGIPVLGVDIGAIGARVKKNNLGWLMDKESDNKRYALKIQEIFSNPEDYGEVIHSINEYKIRSTKEMCDDYERLYSNINKDIQDSNCNRENIKSLIKISDTYFINTTSMCYPDYSWVFDTLKWKIISKFKIPQSIKSAYAKIKNR